MRAIDMEKPMITYDQKEAASAAEIETLLDTAFGADRLQKASYTLRDGVDALSSLSWTAYKEGRLVGSIQFWPVTVHDDVTGDMLDALLLGPLAVVPDLHGTGIGQGLINRGVERALQKGHKLILLVGKREYYSRFGFVPVMPKHINLPGGKDADRLMVYACEEAATLSQQGHITRKD